MERGAVASTVVGQRRPSNRPLTQAIYLAAHRVDRGDSKPRIHKLGELIVRKALAGDNDMIKMVGDRLDGKVTPLDSSGEPVDLASSVVAQLIESLVERRLASAQPMQTIEGTATTEHPVDKMTRLRRQAVADGAGKD